jgi:anionic cell wall polymer biosynthesis LytR-Cps2A-Psr (LCP) family protein
MQTLEALYDIEFNYYAKVTFNSLIEIVNALGGITVESEHNFTAYSESGRGYKYVKGKNNLNGDQALAFVRERKSFSYGDRQRGRNQQIVIRGIIDKALSPSILNPSKFKELLSSVTSNVETNFATDEITALFRMQLKDMSGWDIQSIAVDGKGSMRPTYSSSASLSVIIPDQSTIDTAKNTIKAFLKGETYIEPENTEETETTSKSK